MTELETWTKLLTGLKTRLVAETTDTIPGLNPTGEVWLIMTGFLESGDKLGLTVITSDC